MSHAVVSAWHRSMLGFAQSPSHDLQQFLWYQQLEAVRAKKVAAPLPFLPPSAKSSRAMYPVSLLAIEWSIDTIRRHSRCRTDPSEWPVAGNGREQVPQP